MLHTYIVHDEHHHPVQTGVANFASDCDEQFILGQLALYLHVPLNYIVLVPTVN